MADSNVLKISRAASIGIHAVVLMASDTDRRFSVQAMAKAIAVSPDHLAKVMQQLANAGLIRSTRGPGGGFELAKSPSEVSMMDVFEAIEGPFNPSGCLLDKPICHGRCVLGHLISSVNEMVYTTLRRTRLDRLPNPFVASHHPSRPEFRTTGQPPADSSDQPSGGSAGLGD